MKLSSKVLLHPLTVVLFFVGFLTGYVRYIFYIFTIVFIHELGHVMVAKVFKRKVVSVTLLPFGGMTKMEGKISENIFEDLLIAIAGVFFQTILGYVLILVNNTGLISPFTFEFLNTYNIILIGFNLLPICPLDGYKIVKLASELFIPFKAAAIGAMGVSLCSLCCACVVSPELFQKNIFVFIFLVFMIVEEAKVQKYVDIKFYVERMNYDFYYSRIDVHHIKSMFKNRVNYIDGMHEKDFLKSHFTRKDD